MSSACASYYDEFDTPHDPFVLCFSPQGSVCAHQDQLLEVEELVLCDSPNLLVLLTLINLIPRMIYFITTFHLHGGVRAHLDQLLEVEELVHATHLI